MKDDSGSRGGGTVSTDGIAEVTDAVASECTVTRWVRQFVVVTVDVL